jgi:hypothetical protein
MVAARSFEMFVSYHITTWHHKPEDHDLRAKIHPEDGVSIAHQNVGILPHHYMASQPRRHQHRCLYSLLKKSWLSVTSYNMGGGSSKVRDYWAFLHVQHISIILASQYNNYKNTPTFGVNQTLNQSLLTSF